MKQSELKGGDNEKNDSRRSSSTSPKKKTSTGKKIRHGDRVEAKVKGWTKYYRGEVTRVNDDGTYDIKFDDGERKRGKKNQKLKEVKMKTMMNLILMIDFFLKVFNLF